MVLTRLVIIFYISVLYVGSLQGEDMLQTKPSKLTTVTSSYSPSETVEKIKQTLKAKGITLFTLVDHSGEAHKVSLELNFEQLLIFGDPKTGTLLMQENPAIGIELPLKILVWQDADGKTQVSYIDPNSLKEDYGIKKNAEILTKLSGALSQIISNSIK
jgi:uncharacterized protein (DUF302 family)